MKQNMLLRWNIRIGFRLLLVFLTLGLAACNRATNTLTPVPPTSDAGLAYQPAAGSVGANGTLKPAQQVPLSFGVGGTVASVEVEVGERVQAGQKLALLDTTELERAVAQAELDLRTAQTQLAQVAADAEPMPERVLAASAAITQARAALTQARVQAGQRSNQAIIDSWELEQAADAVQDAQNEYQKVVDDPRTTTWAPSSPEARDLDDAEEHYDVVLARYEMHAADHAYAVAIADAEARLAQAQLSLYEAQNPRASEEITLAQLDVERAQLALEAAQADLAQATLRVPFDGIIAAVPVSVGEWAAPGVTAVELLDLSQWHVETKNVGELQIGRVQVGQEVLVRVNAFRDETLHGHVETISPVAVVQQGDTTYTLMIALAPTDLNLRPGMTAQVEIIVE